MKKLFLLLLLIGAGLTTQAQADNWQQRFESFEQVYHLATELNKETEKITAQGSVVSVMTGSGTISLERKQDKSKPENVQAYKYNLLTSSGKQIPLNLENSEQVIESFHSKLLKLKEELRVNHDQEVDDILSKLFQ